MLVYEYLTAATGQLLLCCVVSENQSIKRQGEPLMQEVNEENVLN